MKFIHQDVFHKLDVNHRVKLFNTPFLHFFVMPQKLSVPNAVLHSILSCYSVENGYFDVKGKHLYFTKESVSHFLCLPSKGKVVDMKPTRELSVFRQKYFPGKKRIVRKDLETVIKAVIDDHSSPPEDVTGLLVLYVFTTILFPNTHGSVSMSLFRYREYLKL